MIRQNREGNPSIVQNLRSIKLCCTGVSRTYIIICVLVCLTATLFRLVNLQAKSIDGDELFSRSVALLSLPEAVEKIRQDIVHPPLYYMLLKLTVWFIGDGVIEIRTISVISGCATILVLLLFVDWFNGCRYPAVLAAGLMALNHQHINASQTARSYAFYAFLIAVLLVWCLFLEKFRKHGVFWLAGFALFVASLYTHYVSILYLSCILIAVLLGSKLGNIKAKVAVMFVSSCTLLLPWIASIYDAYQEKQGLGPNLGWIVRPTLQGLKAVWAEFLGVPAFPGATTIVFVATVSLVVAAAWLGSLRGDSRHRTLALAIMLTAIVPPVALFLLSKAGGGVSFFGFRHLLPSMAPWCLLVSYGLHKAAHLSRAPRAVFMCGALALLSFGLGASIQHRWEGPVGFQFKAMAEALKSGEFQGMKAYATWAGIREPVNYYVEIERVELLGDGRGLPGSFVVLFRPTIKVEQAAVDRLLKGGCFILQRRKYGNPPDAYPVLVVMDCTGRSILKRQ